MDLIREINEKYSTLEAEVDKKLENVRQEEEKLANLNKANGNSRCTSTKMLSYEEALERNANLLKSLEMAKARLRSRSTYSPVEQILQKAIENYKRELETMSCSKSFIQQENIRTLRNDVTQQQKEHHAIIKPFCVSQLLTNTSLIHAYIRSLHVTMEGEGAK